ncbi:MAG: xanthine dehydrogenase accessory protein XdhC [Myxococcota bacterium]|nr:xanthine dehydrogenase accessory protein XdhC [Myxococcota bacterium]
MSYEIWKHLATASTDGPSCALVTITQSKGSTPQGAGAKMVVQADGEIIGTIGGGAVEYRAIQEAKKSIQDGKNQMLQLNLTHHLGMCCGGVVHILIEVIKPVERLYIEGAGHVGLALAKLCLNLDFQVTLVESRIDFVDEDQIQDFTFIEKHPVRFLQKEKIFDNAYHFITTHEHALDFDILHCLLPCETRYLGMIGSKTKRRQFQKRFEVAGVDMTLMQRLFTPAGLEIGGQTPNEIAVSIAAQLIQTRYQR